VHREVGPIVDSHTQANRAAARRANVPGPCAQTAETAGLA
jgi:hypothetical protein